ncbi:ExeM/NucH family extracellular endonuclease [Marinobacter sp.]|uniref:ExeM/NucH family extracellular endonuclease n=1 Tax=Marinobacter sp. TaxID=50741 RepID=UPI003567641C
MLKTAAVLVLLIQAGHGLAQTCGGPHTAISAVQGPGATTPLAGQTVTVEGIITLDLRQPGGFEGFYLQQAGPEQDDDPATSEAVFIHTRAGGGRPGDRVRLRGKAGEYYGLTSLSQVKAISVCDSPGLPAPVAFHPGQTPADIREPLEGMLVHVEQPLTVTDTWNLARYGELALAPEVQWVPTQLEKPAPGLARRLNAQEQVRLLLDDGHRRQNPRPIPWPPGNLAPDNPVRVGDQAGPLTGILDYRFGHWRLQPLKPPEFHSTEPRLPAPGRHDNANLRVASLNLGNLFNGNGQGDGFPSPRGARTQGAYQQQQARLAAQIAAMDPDILAVSELENDGYGSRSALAQLSRQLGPHWLFVVGSTDSHNDEIRNAILYRSDRVRPMDNAQLIDRGAFRQWHRPALVQGFRRAGGSESLTIVAVHLKSKSCRNAPSSQQDRGDGQACYAGARTDAARELVRWTADHGADRAGVLMVGDFNSYAMEDPLRILAAAGYHDLIREFHGVHTPTFRFHGRLGTLDYHLVNDSARQQVLASHVWAVNAEEPGIWAYDAPGGFDLPPDHVWRASDHNPVITDLRLEPR